MTETCALYDPNGGQNQDLNAIVDEAGSLFARAPKLITDGTVVPEKIDRAIDFLALARDGLRRLDVIYKAAVEPIKKQLAPFDAQRKAAKSKYEFAEEALTQAVSSFIKEHGRVPEETKSGTKLTLVSRKSAEVVKASEIPDAFLLPRAQCIDMAKVEAELAAGREVPGARMGEKLIIRTQLPEIIA